MKTFKVEILDSKTRQSEDVVIEAANDIEAYKALTRYIERSGAIDSFVTDVVRIR